MWTSPAPAGVCPPALWWSLGGRFFYLVHSVGDLDLNPVAAGIAVVVSGHTHRAEKHVRDGVLYLNPGSAGPRRFDLPVTLARVGVTDGAVRARIVKLASDERAHPQGFDQNL